MTLKIWSLLSRRIGGHSGAVEEAKLLENAQTFQRVGQLDQARVAAERLAKTAPTAAHLRLLAEISLSQKDTSRASDLLTSLIDGGSTEPLDFYRRGNIQVAGGNLEGALTDFDRAIALDSTLAKAHCNLGVVLERLNRLDSALDSFDRALALDPLDSLSHFNRGEVLRRLKRPEAAAESYDRSIALDPRPVRALCNLGVILAEQKKWDAAQASYARCLELDPQFYVAYFNRAAMWHKRRCWEAALQDYDKAIALKYDYAEAICGRGVLHTDLGNWQSAQSDIAKALTQNFDLAEAHCAHAYLAKALSREDEALAAFSHALSLKPNYVEALVGQADIFSRRRQFERAIENLDRALDVNPQAPFVPGAKRGSQMSTCEWHELDDDVARLSQGIERREPMAPPFQVLSLIGSEHLQLLAAQSWVQEECPESPMLPPLHIASSEEGRIRIGYFSCDFHSHPVGQLVADVIETHDRSNFEVIGFSFGADVRDPVRERLERGFDRFFDVRSDSDTDIARLARRLDIHVAIDLGGFTAGARTRIFASRAAPLQVNYLGYPGTMGANYMDYIIADATVIPDGSEQFFSEKIAHLPGSFLPAGSPRMVSAKNYNRDEMGLPSSGFVFCCFNNSYKILPDVFDRWMSILRRVNGSVLWLSGANARAVVNLRVEAERRGIAPERLIFAGHVDSPADHLARLGLGDLFLDTLPYNAHATALDSLWAGLPLLTCRGRTFAGRVGASLLSSAGLPELIAECSQEYEELAVQFALDPARLGILRSKLKSNRRTMLQFDCVQYTRHLEEAYVLMLRRHRVGAPPQHLRVTKS